MVKFSKPQFCAVTYSTAVELPRLFFLPFSHGLFFIQTNKLCAVAFKEQIDLAGRPVPMLGDDQFRGMDRFVPRIFVIVFPVQEHHDVRVLFQ